MFSFSLSYLCQEGLCKVCKIFMYSSIQLGQEGFSLLNDKRFLLSKQKFIFYLHTCIHYYNNIIINIIIIYYILIYYNI